MCIRDRIIIEYEEKHPKWDYYFVTKYFHFEKPGEMFWGHQGEKMYIEIY